MMELKVNGLKKKYGRKVVLDGIDLSAGEGECIGLIGGNGSGKSTFLSILAGIIKADDGSFMVKADGKPVKMGYVPQGTPLIPELSARDNLLLWYDRKALQQELQSGVLQELGIPDFLKVPVRKMSGGMKKRLSIGCAVAGGPQVLLMDEPTAALDIACKNAIYEYMKSFQKKGGIILLATHDIHEIELCDRCYLLTDGKMQAYVYDGDMNKLAERMK